MTTEPDLPEDSTPSNTVKVTCSTITSISYVDGSLNRPLGQPASPPPTIEQSGDTWKITLKCGREGSRDVALHFNNSTGGSIHEVGDSHIDKKPDELNFYFMVQMTLLYNGTEFTTSVYLGQGSIGARNNWWIGGNAIVNGCLVLIADNTIQQVLTVSGDISSFTLTPAS